MAWEPDYAVVPDLKSYLKILDTDDDPELQLAVTAASRAIDDSTNRQFGVTDTTEQRIYEGKWSRRHGRWKFSIDDLMTLTGLDIVVSGSSLTSSQYELRELNAAVRLRPWERLLTDSATPPTSGTAPCTVLITGTWGWTAIPDTIKETTLLQAGRFFVRKESLYGVAGSPEFGSELRLLPKVDPDVSVMLRNYRRNYPLI